MTFGQGQHLKKLISERDRLDKEMAALKTERAAVEDAILSIADPLAAAAYKRANKVDGTVPFALDNEMFKSVIDKRVSYDSEALQRIAGSIPFEKAMSLFKVEYSISEKVFQAITDADLKKRITDARTVKYGAPKITTTDK